MSHSLCDKSNHFSAHLTSLFITALYPGELVPPPEFKPQLVSPPLSVQETSARTLGILSKLLPLPYPHLLTLL